VRVAVEAGINDQNLEHKKYTLPFNAKNFEALYKQRSSQSTGSVSSDTNGLVTNSGGSVLLISSYCNAVMKHTPTTLLRYLHSLLYFAYKFACW
jgi:hypothetical protein